MTLIPLADTVVVVQDKTAAHALQQCIIVARQWQETETKAFI